MKILTIIPAREGSKRVTQKNFRPFANTTLVDLAIQQALQSKLISKIVVSSDSEIVLDIAKKYTSVLPLRRPSEISGDLAPAIDYVKQCLLVLEEQGEFYDIIVILQPSSPLRTFEDIDQTIITLINNKEADSAVSVVKVSHMLNPLKLKIIENGVLIPYFDEEKGRFAKEDLPTVFVRNCAVYVTWRRVIEEKSDIIGDISIPFEMPTEKSIDINDTLEFEFAQFLYKKALLNKSKEI
jgi:CMP-N-acetylneuraminic acid synthetase